MSLIGSVSLCLKSLEYRHFSGNLGCCDPPGGEANRLLYAGMALFRHPGQKAIVSKRAIVSSISQRRALCVDGLGVQVFIPEQHAGLQQNLPLLREPGHGLHEQALDSLLGQIRSAAAPFTLELRVTLKA